MSTQYRFKRIPLRDDTAEIKDKCYRDSVPQKETGDTWNTLYNDTYVRHPLAMRQSAKGAGEKLMLGGGNLEPTPEEKTSNYQQFFHGFDRTDVPPKANPLPCSDIFPRDNTCPKFSESQERMKEALDNRPPYDNREARERVVEGHKAHFFFGDDDPSYGTTYEHDFQRYRGARPASIDNALQKSHLAFDPVAGVGPHTKKAQKHGTFPEIGDAPKPDHLKINFDIGYDDPNYTTTMQSSLQVAGRTKRPESFKAPACAELSTHGDAAPPWQTLYNTTFTDRKPIPNPIDKADLRKTHFDIGHDENDWHRDPMAVTSGVPERPTIDLQQSNQVFRGDGDMRFQTTSSDMIGVYDRSIDGRGKTVDAREDHLYLGSDQTDYESEAKRSNRMAGKGKPAERCQDLHLLRGVGFARGGAWDPYTGCVDSTDEKSPRGQPTIEKVDPRYFRESHFELDATNSNKARYKTTYFEEICRPKLAN